MPLTLIEVDGELYHAQEFYDEEGDNIVDTQLILDSDDKMIPASICHAFEPGECCCATTAWENYRYDDYDMEDEDDTAQTDVD